MTTIRLLPVGRNPSGTGRPAPLRIRPAGPIGALLLFVLLTQTPGIAPAQQKFRNAFFPHRSVGLCFWNRAKVSNLTPPTTIPHEMDSYNSAHGYTGSNKVTMFVDPDDNPTPAPMNNWEDWDRIFAGNEWAPTFWNYVSQYQIIIVKTGYPATQQMSYGEPWTISTYQAEWRRIIKVMSQHPDKFFVITTNYPAATDGHSDRAQLSNQFCLWAKNTLATGNDSYGAFPRNVHVMDWFHWLASSSDGYCDPSYGSGGEGPGADHPSNAAVAVVDPKFVKEVFDAAIAYEGGALAATWAGPPMLTVNLSHRVSVAWQTLSEINTYRFYVERQGEAWTTIDSVNAGGTSLSSRNYSVTDAGVSAGTWVYRIREVDLDGSIHYSETATATIAANGSGPSVTAYALEQNFPNPFNPSTTIQYALPGAANVKLTVFNMLGEETATLVNEARPAGVHTVQFDGSRLASGLYFYRLQAGQYVEMKKFVLLK